MEPATIIALVSATVAMLSFAFGRITANKKEGQDIGVIIQKLNNLSENMERVEKQVDRITERLDNQVDKIQQEQGHLRDRVSALEAAVGIIKDRVTEE